MTVTADATTYAGAASASNATSYTTASHTPVAGDRVLVVVGSGHATLAPNTPTITGNGQTWTNVGSVTVGTIRATIFSCLVASPSAGTCAIDFGGQTQQRCVWSFVGYRSDAGTITLGTAATNSGTATSGSVTVTDPGGGDGVHSGCYKNNGSEAFTKDANYTLADENNTGAETGRQQTQYLINSVSDLTPGWSWTSSVTWAAVGVVLLEPSGPFNVTPTGLAQTVSFGAPSVLFVTPSGLAVTAGIGVPTLQSSLAPSGLTVTPTFGTPTLSVPYLPAGFDQTVSFGTASLTVPIQVTPASFDQTVTFGTPTLSMSVAPAGLEQTVAFGTPSLSIPVSLAVTGLGQIQSTANIATYNTTTDGAGAIAATATGNAVFAVVNAVESAGTVPTPTLSNHSALPFGLLTATTGTNPTTSGLEFLAVYACLATATTSDDVDVVFANAQVGCNVSFFEITGFASPPAAIADVVRQFEINGSSSDTTSLVVLSAFASTDNINIFAAGALVIPAAEDVAPEAGAAQIHELGFGSPNRTLITTWEKNDESPSVTWTTASAMLELALEINASGTAGPLTVTPSGLAVTATFGQPSVLFLTPTGLTVTATFGVPTLTIGGAGFDVTPTGLAVTAEFGAASLSLLVHVNPAGFEQPVVFGTPTLAVVAGLTVTPSGLTVAVVFGAPATTGLDDLPAIAITARLDAMFYRNTTKLGLALVPLGNTQPLGFRRSETWQRVSSRFVMNQGTADAVMALMPAVWSAHSAASQTELTTAINTKLQDAGYRKPGGADLT